MVHKVSKSSQEFTKVHKLFGSSQKLWYAHRDILEFALVLFEGRRLPSEEYSSLIEARLNELSARAGREIAFLGKEEFLVYASKGANKMKPTRWKRKEWLERIRVVDCRPFAFDENPLGAVKRLPGYRWISIP